MKFGPNRTHYLPWRPCWISDWLHFTNLAKDQLLNISVKLCWNLFSGFRKCEILIGSNVKLSFLVEAILNFRSANDLQLRFPYVKVKFCSIFDKMYILPYGAQIVQSSLADISKHLHSIHHAIIGTCRCRIPLSSLTRKWKLHNPTDESICTVTCLPNHTCTWKGNVW